MNFNLNTFLMGVSIALDLSEKEILSTNSFHSKRVAYISLRIAQELGLSDEECFDLVSLAILHDNGLTEAALIHKLDKDSELEKLENLKDHCSIGELNIINFPFLTNPKNIILYHHEHYDGSGFYGKKHNEIPLMSRIISFADEIDFKYNLSDNCLNRQNEIKDFAQDSASVLHDSDIIQAFLNICKNKAFWLDMQEITINYSLNDYIPNISINVTWEQIFEITKVFSKIIDSKSKYTYYHTSGLIEKVSIMADYYKFDNNKRIKLKIAAALHDLGKLAIPNKILDKDCALSKEEFETIKTHTYFTHFTLRNLEDFKEIDKWAYCHHEKLNGGGYPYGLTAKELGFEERLIACLDIYQALTEDRPYRKGLTHKEALLVMESMVEKNHIDSQITQDIKIVFNN